MTSLSTTPITTAVLRGAAELETTERGLLPHRLPHWVRARYPDPQLLMAESQPSGVRLAMRTTATVIELVTIPTKRLYRGLPPRPDGIYDLVVDGNIYGRASVPAGDTVTVDLATGSTEYQAGEPGVVRYSGLPAGNKDVELWLPHNETTELVALRSNAALAPIEDDRPIWLHHGSSISHGSNAERPTGTWPALAARAGGVNLVNLGLGGSALLDPFIARTMRDSPADLISLKLGINLVNADLMRRRALGPAVHGYLDTLRDGHPATPVLLVSALHCPIHEQTPGPGAFDPVSLKSGIVRFRATGDPADVPAGRLTLEVIREELGRVVAQRHDPHLHLLDGRQLYGPADEVTHPLPDGLHPDAATHEVIARRFTRLAFGTDGPFALHRPRPTTA